MSENIHSSIVQTVTADISDNFSDGEQRESKQLLTDYQYQLSPEMKIYSDFSF